MIKEFGLNHCLPDGKENHYTIVMEKKLLWDASDPSFATKSVVQKIERETEECARFGE